MKKLDKKQLAARIARDLPDGAAVNEFVMSVGPRHIRAIIREKQEAQQLYREARPMRRGPLSERLAPETVAPSRPA